jgi:hypothetical protein
MFKKLFIILFIFLCLGSAKQVLAVAETSFEQSEGYVLDENVNGYQNWVGDNNFYVRDEYNNGLSTSSFEYGWFLRSEAGYTNVLSHQIASASVGSQYWRMGTNMTGGNYCEVSFMNDDIGQFSISIQEGSGGYIVFHDGLDVHNLVLTNPDHTNRLVYFGILWNQENQSIDIQIGSSSFSFESVSFNGINGIGLSSMGTIGECYFDEFSSFGSYFDSDVDSIWETYFGTKIPFVYFFQLYDVLDNLATLSASTSYGFDALTMTIPATKMGGESDIEVHLASLSYIYAIMPVDKWALFKDLLRGGLIFTTLIYFFIRIKGLLHPVGTS